MVMFKTCQAKIVSTNPALCGNRSDPNGKIFKCTGHCAGCYGKCRSIRTASNGKDGVEVCAVDHNYMYTHVKALHGDERERNPQHPGYQQLTGNANGDCMPWKGALLAYNPKIGMRAYESWYGRDVLENHDETRIVGDIPDIWLTIPDKCVHMLMRTDKRRAWNICESVRQGKVTDTSMGVLVGYSLCSICNNKATTESEWCNHLKYTKGKFVSASELSKENQKQFPMGKYCCEINYDLIGLENSWITVGEGADSEAKVQHLIAGYEDLGQKGSQFKGTRLSSLNIVDRYWTEHGRKG